MLFLVYFTARKIKRVYSACYALMRHKIEKTLAARYRDKNKKAGKAFNLTRPCKCCPLAKGVVVYVNFLL